MIQLAFGSLQLTLPDDTCFILSALCVLNVCQDLNILDPFSAIHYRLVIVPDLESTYLNLSVEKDHDL